MWKLAKKKDIPIYISIIKLIVQNIKEEKILPGDRLPSERKLASYFSVNRSTVVHALDELVDLGWITRKQGSGTLVNEGEMVREKRTGIDWREYLKSNAFAKVEPFINETEQLLKQERREILDLYTGELPVELVPSFSFPTLTWKEFLKEEQEDDLGYLPLRVCLSQKLRKEKGIIASPENFLITSGGHQALFLIMHVLLKAGDDVVIEAPSFFSTLPIFQATGIKFHGVQMDDEGICLESLEKKIRTYPIKMVLVNPSFQNPTGKLMSVARRQSLVELCQKYQIPILEDDVFSQLSFMKNEEITPIKKLDPENVLYIGSLSKILGSTTKIGWLIAPASVTRQLAQARKGMDFSLSIFPQVLATKALNTTDFSKKIATVSQTIEERGTLIYDQINAVDGWTIVPPKGGFYAWAIWNKGNIPQKGWNFFLDEGLLVVPSFSFGENRNGVRINFSRLEPQRIVDFQRKFTAITEKLSSLR